MLDDVIERIDSILSFPEMSRDLAAGLDLIRPGAANAEFDAMVARVEGRFESSRNYGVVLQFLQDHSKLRDQEVIRLFEFIYSKLVNKFKGELGEVLAARTIFDFAETLKQPVEVLHGSHVSAHQLVRRTGWHDAADALYVVREGGLYEVMAIAEVKSKATPFDDLRTQVAKNILRLRRGMRLRGVEIEPEQIRIRAGSRTVPATDIDEEQARAVTALFILPWKSEGNGRPVRHHEHEHIWLAELPASQDEITEAGYRFMAWYFARIGPRVFHYIRDGKPPAGDPRVPAAHQDLSLEENGGHAFMEAIYGAALRPVFNPREIAGPGRRTAWQTLLWLYNSMGFGFEQASSKELMYPESTPTPDHEAWLVKHNASMAEYHAGRITEALAIFPDPAQQNYGDWAPREWMLLARLRTRIGDVAGARAALANLRGNPAESQSLSTRMEFAGVQALIALASEPQDAAKAKVREAMEVLESVRAQVREHESRGWGFPADLTPKNARAAVIDLAVAQTLVGDNAKALELLERVRGFDDGELKLLEHDPVLTRMTREPGVLAHLRETSARRGDFAIF